MKKRRLLIFLFLFLAGSGKAQPKGYSIVFLNTNSEAPSIDSLTTVRIREGHFQNMNQLASEGKLLAAGPFEGGGGLFILNTTSVDEAKAWVSLDPAVKEKRFNVEILPYMPVKGSLCKVNEPYQMVNYSFVRFDAIVEKFTASHYPRMIKEHEEFIDKNVAREDIIAQASFGPNQGGVLILKGEVQAEKFDNDPAIRGLLITPSIRKLFIAKGSFCEQ